MPVDNIDCALSHLILEVFGIRARRCLIKFGGLERFRPEKVSTRDGLNTCELGFPGMYISVN